MMHMGDDFSRMGEPISKEKNPVLAAYQSGECPDCGDPIPQDVQEGDECCQCGHVFWSIPPRTPIIDP